LRPSAAFTTGRRPFGKLRVALSNVEGRDDDTTFPYVCAFGAFTKNTKLTKAHKEKLCESLRRIATRWCRRAARGVRSEGWRDHKQLAGFMVACDPSTPHS